MSKPLSDMANVYWDVAEWRPKPPTHFRLTRKVDAGATDEKEGGWREEHPGSYWGKLMLDAKRRAQVVVPDVDACTAWCLAKTGAAGVAGFEVHPMRTPTDGRVRRRIRPASETWGLFLPEAWALKHCVPYFEMTLSKELADMSLAEWLVVMGGLDPKIARAAAERYSKPRQHDKLCLRPGDVEKLLLAAAGREAALAEEAARTTA